jgi:hypothetical protein
MSKVGRTVLALLVSKQEHSAAIQSANALRNLGITLFAFYDQALMQVWLEKMNRIPSISVNLLSEAPHVE